MKKTLFGLLLLSVLIAFTACPSQTGTPNGTPTYSDAELVAGAKKILRINYRTGESAEKVISTVDLESEIHGFKGDIKITWHSNTPTIIKITEEIFPTPDGDQIRMTGEVTRPASNTVVTLTATLSKGTESATKDFKLTVYGTDNEAVDGAFATTNVSPQLIQGNTTPDISFNTDMAVETTWQSDRPTVIATNGTVTRPSAKTEVSLTATIKKGTAKRTKAFVITVYPDGAAANADELLAMISIPSEATADFTVPGEISGSGTAITWASANTDIIEISGTTAKIKPVIFDDQVTTLTATIGTETQDFTITVKGITKKSGNHPSETWDFSATTISNQDGKFTYTAHNTETREFTATRTHVRDPQTFEWITIEQATHDETQLLIAQYTESAKAFKTLSTMASISLRDIAKILLKPFLEAGGIPLPTDDEAIYEKCKHVLINLPNNYADFTALSPTAQTQAIKASIEESRKEACRMTGLAGTTTWEQIISAIPSIVENMQEQQITDAKNPRRYRYSFEPNYNGVLSFITEACYEDGTAWHKQAGSYSAVAPKHIVLNKHFMTHGNLEFDSTYYNGNFDATFTEFTGKSHDGTNTITATITDKNNGTISLNINGTDYTLNFKGHPLH